MAETIQKDLVIIGGGPAGLAAAIYAQRDLLDSVLIEQEALGGKMIITSEIDNYPGVPHTDGYTLTEAMHKQAEDLGAQIIMTMVDRIKHEEDGTFAINTPDAIYRAKAVILAGGALPTKAGFKGEQTYAGHGVSYCATCDGMFFRGKQVFVVGGGNSAAEEALFLTRFASKVTIVAPKDHLSAQGALVSQLEQSDKVDVRYNTRVVSVDGGDQMNTITFRDIAKKENYTETYEDGGFGVFVFAGRTPASQLVGDLVESDERGFVITDEDMRTKTPGLFAAGDVRHKSLRQIVTAAADGAIAENAVSAYLRTAMED